MLFMKFNSQKLIYVISKYRKETQMKENEFIQKIKTNCNVISEI